MRVGYSQWAIKRLRVAINASLVRYVTVSKWTAFTDRETNTQMYALTILGLRNIRSP